MAESGEAEDEIQFLRTVSVCCCCSARRVIAAFSCSLCSALGWDFTADSGQLSTPQRHGGKGDGARWSRVAVSLTAERSRMAIEVLGGCGRSAAQPVLH